MSADNRVCIQQRGDHRWYVWIAMGDGPWRPGRDSKICRSELEAYREAVRICNREIIEYGIRVLAPRLGAAE